MRAARRSACDLCGSWIPRYNSIFPIKSGVSSELAKSLMNGFKYMCATCRLCTGVWGHTQLGTAQL